MRGRGWAAAAWFVTGAALAVWFTNPKVPQAFNELMGAAAGAFCAVLGAAWLSRQRERRYGAALRDASFVCFAGPMRQVAEILARYSADPDTFEADALVRASTSVEVALDMFADLKPAFESDAIFALGFFELRRRASALSTALQVAATSQDGPGWNDFGEEVPRRPESMTALLRTHDGVRVVLSRIGHLHAPW